MLRQSSMETAYSHDCESDEMCGSYNLSADVSESESSRGSFSRRGYDADFASSSVASSPVSYDCLAGNDTFSLPLQTPIVLPVIGGKDVDLSEVEMMKERFAKLLLGEDMSGGGKGVCTALAISNAITNLSASVFGELWRLEPLAPQKKSLWCREMEWLLSVSDSIVELVPSIQKLPGKGRYEVMIPQPRSDLHMNLPALKKLDAMLLSILDGFCDTDFGYADAESQDANSSSVSSGRPSVRQEEKWWLPCPTVPLKGLSCDARKRLQQCRDCTNQILKAALAINSNVLAEMEIPAAYLDTLPKTGKACLGEIIYRYITADKFSPECLLEYLDISSEHQTMDIINRIEAALHVWKQKDQKKHKNNSTNSNRSSSWGGKVKGLVSDSEKNNFLAQRAETLLHSLRLRFPALPQTALDMNKIQYNKDVGQSILESYSRVMESLAFNIMARIDDVIYIDDATRKSTNTEAVSLFKRGGLPVQKRISPSPFSIQHSPHGSPFGTPTFCSSPPIMHSPRRTPSQVLPGHRKLSEVQVAADVDKQWSYAGSLGARRVSGDAPERN